MQPVVLTKKDYLKLVRSDTDQRLTTSLDKGVVIVWKPLPRYTEIYEI